MTRKVVATIIALMMVIAITPLAHANNQQNMTTGTIVFEHEDDKGIIDPDDPDLPDDWEGKWATRSINFGTREIDYVFNNIYNTYDPEVPEVDRRNSLLIWSTAANGWTVDVAITGFFVGGAQTIENFELTLKPLANTAETYNSASHRFTEFRDARIHAAPDGQIGPSANFLKGNAGLSGLDFTGHLDVLANTATEGQAQAQLTWFYIPEVQP